MIILYVNNYRGFQDTYIPLTDVNFLVGENSSGKTSILSLLQVLSSERFWATQEFSTENPHFGYFEEMVSLNSEADYFEVAMFKQEMGSVSAFYFKFVDFQGSPFITEQKSIQGLHTIYIKNGYGVLDYTVIDTKFILEKTPNIDTFCEWLNMSFKDSKFTEYPKNTDNGILNLRNGLLMQIYSSFFPSIKPTKSNFGVLEFAYMTDLTPIAPIRAKPQRIYEGYKVSFTTEGDHIPYLLKSIMESKNYKEIKQNIESFGDNSGLFEKLKIKKLGDDNISPFEIHISLGGNTMKLTNVGYGVSQILPVLVEILSKKDGTWFAIQQPEVHLHPKAQAALGELFFNIAKAENKSFLIETHSDYLIDRYRLALRKANKKEKKPTSNAQVLFFERTAEGNKVHILPIDEKGDYPEEQPDSFRDFFITEELNLLTY
jgi:predicted ATPase